MAHPGTPEPYRMVPWEHGPADECPLCSRCPVLTVADNTGGPHMYSCLVCEYYVPAGVLARLVMIRKALGTPRNPPG